MNPADTLGIELCSPYLRSSAKAFAVISSARRPPVACAWAKSRWAAAVRRSCTGPCPGGRLQHCRQRYRRLINQACAHLLGEGVGRRALVCGCFAAAHVNHPHAEGKQHELAHAPRDWARAEPWEHHHATVLAMVLALIHIFICVRYYALCIPLYKPYRSIEVCNCVVMSFVASYERFALASFSNI